MLLAAEVSLLCRLKLSFCLFLFPSTSSVCGLSQNYLTITLFPSPPSMKFRILTCPSGHPLLNTSLNQFAQIQPRPFSSPQFLSSPLNKKLFISVPRKCPSLFVSSCISSGQEGVAKIPEIRSEDDRNFGLVTKNEGEESEVMEIMGSKAEELGNQSLWNQMKDIVMFTGPATGLWICGPLMSLIDTAVIGQGSSLELAALGPGTVLCDYMSYVFMFLSVATSNMVATSLARLDKEEVQHQISILLFVGLVSGFFMLFFTKFFGLWALTAFAGPNNVQLVPAANTYAQIRGIAWPAVLVGWVAQSASLGMKDSWGPLKALAAASVINGIGDIVLCSYLGYGIAGAAWATMVSQVVAAYMMIEALNKKGYKAFAISIPSSSDVLSIVGIAAPVFVTMMSKVAFYSVMIYFATSMGTNTVAAHQVMLQVFSMCTVCGEPLSQTAQTFMPELIHGINRSLAKAKMLLKSLIIIGAALGLLLGVVGILVPWLFPTVFTPDQPVIQEMHKVLVPYFFALVVTPSTHSLEGTLMAGRDNRFLSISMTGCFSLCGLVVLLLSNRGCGLPGCWWALAGFQWARFSLALKRLLSPNGVLSSQDLSQLRFTSK